MRHADLVSYLVKVSTEAELVMAMTAHGRSTGHRLEAANLLQLPANEAVVAQVGHAVLHEGVQHTHPQHCLHSIMSAFTGLKMLI